MIHGYTTNSLTKNVQFISRLELKWLPELFPYKFHKLNLSNNIFKNYDEYISNKNNVRNSEFRKKLKFYIRQQFKIEYLKNMSNNKSTPIIDHYTDEILKKLKN